MYALSVKPDWKLAFNKGGQPLVMNKMRKKYLKCRHFTKIEIDNNGDGDNNHQHQHQHHHHHHHHHYHHNNQQIYNGKTGHNKLIKYAEDGICSDWEKLGEQIFDEEIHRDPRLNCILTHHPQFSRLDSKQLQQELKRRKLFDANNQNNQNVTEMAITKSNRCFNVSDILFNDIDADNSQSNNRQQRNLSNGGGGGGGGGQTTITSKKIRRLPKKVRHLCG
ncbi:hypothetical protein BLA29_000257 [Euroglyphus maynei]|uniref:Uncharacterized protein n=1 Tax=Euroglyphus maynei TaxID=6958 RepID=A0A1Y3BCW5_EURMA|nr:hypothetical protein BLA29_000257 [Euroglyphus maynei]